MGVKITAFEAENVKRVKAVQLEPAQDGLTVIGGRNGQGKTSVLDAIAWALGGARMCPTDARREGAAGDPRLRVELSNGIVVERKGKASALKVTDPMGRKSGQALLDSFVETLALDLPKFMNASDKEKAETLLGIIGVGDRLAELDAERQRLYNQRLAIGQMERQKRGAAEDMAFYPDAPAEPVSTEAIMAKQRTYMEANAENARVRMNAGHLKANAEASWDRVLRLKRELAEAEKAYDEDSARAAAAAIAADSLEDWPMDGIEAELRAAEAANEKLRVNRKKREATAEADELRDQYKELDEAILGIDRDRKALLDGAELPLEGLGVQDGLLTYRGRRWDCMSGSQQLMVATAIVRAVKPECGFVLVDKLEQFDADTLRDFGTWAQAEGLQVIGTRVSTGDECSIIIEDGRAAEPAAPSWNI